MFAFFVLYHDERLGLFIFLLFDKEGQQNVMSFFLLIYGFLKRDFEEGFDYTVYATCLFFILCRALKI
jgi:hypothetical protein